MSAGERHGTNRYWLDVAVIGAGFMGALHARAIAESPTARLAAVVDPDLDRAGDIGTRYGAAVYPDHHRMLATERPRAVVVCTPEREHRAPVLDAAAHGCAILVEKPMAATLADADAMIAICRQHRVPLMVGYILRFEPAYARIKQAVAEGMVGRLLTAYARRNAPIGEGVRLAGRTTVVNYLAVHDADQMLWYHPAAVSRVTARAVQGKIHEAHGVADFAWTTLEFADGALGTIESGWALAEGWAGWSQPTAWDGFGDVQMNVIGTDGVLSLGFTPMDVVGVDREGWKLPDTRHWPIVNGRLGGALRAEMDHFLACAATGESPLIDGAEGRRSLEIAIAANRSIHRDRPVTLPL